MRTMKCIVVARANAFRKYGDDWKSGFPDRSLARLRAWGLNTVSSWSDAAVQRSGKIPYTVKPKGVLRK